MNKRILFPLGLKIMLMTFTLLSVSLAGSGVAMMSLTRKALRKDLTEMISRDSQLLADASRFVVQSDAPKDKAKLKALSQSLLANPGIIAVALLDSAHKVVVQSSQAAGLTSSLASLEVPIKSANKTIGWVRATYTPSYALQEFWSMAGDLGVVLICSILFLFAVILLLFNHFILSRPFGQFLVAMDDAQTGRQLPRLPINRYDEWGVLARRMQEFFNRLSDIEEQASTLALGSRLMGTPTDLKSAVENLLPEVVYRHELHLMIVFLPDADKVLRIHYATGISAEFAKAVAVRPGEGVVGVAFVSGEIRLVEDVAHSADDVMKELVERQNIAKAFLLPLKSEGSIEGVVVCASRAAVSFSDAQKASLQGFTDQLARALQTGSRFLKLGEINRVLEFQNTAALEELNRVQERLIHKVRELKTVYDLALTTAASGRLDEIIAVIIKGVRELVDVQSGAFFIFDASGKTLVPLVPAFDKASFAATALEFQPESSPFLQRVLEKGAPVVTNFVSGPEMLPPGWAGIGVRSIIALPLRQGQEVKGLFCVINKLNGPFGDEDVQLLSLLTGRVADVLHRFSLDESLRQRMRDLTTLQDIATQLPSPPTLVETLGVIGQIAREAVAHSDFCGFFVYHPESEVLALMGGDWSPDLAFDPKALTIGVSEKLPLAQVFRDGKEFYAQRKESQSVWALDGLAQALTLGEILYEPLIVEGHAIGVMTIARRPGPLLSAEDRRLAHVLSEQVGVILERSRLYERLRSANAKLEQMNTLKNEFISMVSHELRTPLTTIKGFVSIVLEEETGPLNKQQRHFLETSDRAIDRLTLLVSDLLDISRIEAGQIKMQLRPTSLKEVIHRIAVNFEPQMKSQGLEFLIEVAENLPPVMADSHRLTQVIDNLLSNALKFTTKGSITIAAADKGDFVMVSVRDTGQGIDMTEQDKIFDKFYQVKVGSGWPAKGTGLGLAIVKSIVSSHRGKVWVEAELGKGSNFSFLIPRARVESIPAKPIPQGEIL